MNDEKMLLEQLMNLEWSAKYGYGIGGAVPVEHIGDDGFVFNAVIKQGSESNLRDMFDDSELITSAEFIKEVINNLEEKQNRINELTEFLSNYPEVTVFPRERNELLRLKEEVKFLNDIVDRFSLNVISIINKKSAQCDLNDYDNLKMANYAAREKVTNLLDALIVLPKYDKVNKYLDLKRRLDNRMVAVPLLDEKIQELNDLLFSIRQDGINIPSNLKYDSNELESYRRKANPNLDGNDDCREKAEEDWIKASEDADRRHREAEEARKEQEEIEKELEKEQLQPSPNPKTIVSEPVEDWREKADDDWIKASEDANRRHREAEEARKEQEEIERELEKKQLQPSPNPNPQPTPVPEPAEDWRKKADDDWIKASEDANRRHREVEEARKEQEEIEKELEKEKKAKAEHKIDPDKIKLNFGKYDDEYGPEKKQGNNLNMILGSVDMANLFRNNNSVNALLSGIDPSNRTRVGNKISNSKVVTKISSIPDKIAEKLSSRKINSRNSRVVAKMKNIRQKFRNKFSNGVSISENYKINKAYNDIMFLKDAGNLSEELEKNPGYYRDLCNYILDSGSTGFYNGKLKEIEEIRDEAIEIVRTKFSGKGRS
jgi:hypothetical protein